MSFFSYVVEHDYGLAPNPFGEYCTLAVCKPQIRKNKNLKIGDWIIGTGSKKLQNLNHLVYTMKVDRKITFQEYWDDKTFRYKIPNLNGSLVQIFGDNFYHKDPETQEWIQEDSAHSRKDREKHIKQDLSGENVLIGQEFYYLGDASVLIPDQYQIVCNKGRGFKYKEISLEIGSDFIQWIKSNFQKGINGDPINWKEFSAELSQLRLF